MIDIDNERLEALTRSLIALIVVVGGGLTMVFRSEVSDIVAPVITLVVGFYFGQGAARSGFNQAMRAQAANRSAVDTASVKAVG